ncbi:MAG TPA: hypothetical protein VMU30_01925 [Bacteroidota bacterium]|nr:hypothetical protein [Bacteroidota bacterium]
MKQRRSTAVLVLACVTMFSMYAIGQTRSGKFGVGIDASGQYVLGAGSPSSGIGPGGGVSLFYSPWESIGLRSNLVYNQLSWTALGTGKSITTDVMSDNLYLSFDMAPNSSFNPFIFAGGGVAVFDPKDEYLGFRNNSTTPLPSNFDINYGGGVGFDYFFSEFWSVTLMGEYVMTGSQYYVGSHSASDFNLNASPVTSNLNSNDSFARVSLQIRYYFFDENFITKLLKAQRDRLKPGK